MLTGEESQWTDERNRILAMALTLLEAESCNNCGTPSWIGHSTNNEIGFRVESGTCFGCAELERVEEHAQKGQRKNQKGEFKYVVPQMVWPDQPLPSRAELYGARDTTSKE